MDSVIYSSETQEEKLKRLSKEHNYSEIHFAINPSGEASKDQVVDDLISYFEYKDERKYINVKEYFSK